MDIVLNSVRVRTRWENRVGRRERKAKEKKAAHLPDDGTLEDDEHEKGEETVIPIFIETPEGDTEDLEDEERGGGLLRKKVDEGRDGDVELVLAKELVHGIETGRREAAGLEEGI
jgi:hypothetical protein